MSEGMPGVLRDGVGGHGDKHIWGYMFRLQCMGILPLQAAVEATATSETTEEATVHSYCI